MTSCLGTGRRPSSTNKRTCEKWTLTARLCWQAPVPRTIVVADSVANLALAPSRQRTPALRQKSQSGQGQIRDYAIVDALGPQPGDIVVPKTRLSGFFETTLDYTIRGGVGINTLIFAGVATSICVQATNATRFTATSVPSRPGRHQRLGPGDVKNATLFNPKMILGWVTNTDALCQRLSNAECPPRTDDGRLSGDVSRRRTTR